MSPPSNVNGTIADAAQREQALDPEQSFIVQAPAGSGKTELLVRRFVRLLGTVERPEEVLAITFTRKAAAEMKKRVLAGLDGKGNARDLVPRLRIMTIDSLCASLTRQMPVLARFGAQPGIAETEEARALYLDAAMRTLAQVEGTGPAALQVARLLAHLDNNVAEAAKLLSGMLARRDQWLRHAGNPPTRAELEAAFSAERERLIAHAMSLHPGASPEFAAEVLTQAGTWRKKPRPAPAELVNNEPLRLALFALMRMPPATYSPAQWEVLESILALLKLAAAELKLVFGERGQADFTEYAQAAVMALGSADDPSELLLRMDAGIRHILVDEFQDTSVSQWDLLECLTAGWEPGDGRTVFAVGDPMQSIYRFREAEVALFLRARHAGLGTVSLQPLALSTNFRSQAGIVDWVNATFSRVLPVEEDESSGAVPYAHAVAHPARGRLDGPAAIWHPLTDQQTARHDEAQRVVAIACDARCENPAGTCAILVRNRSALAEIVPALNLAGIRFRAVEIEKLGEKQVIQDLVALVRALAHPADRVAWLAVLRARWCGLLLADLHALAGNDEPQGGQASDRVPPDRLHHSPGLDGRTLWELMHDPDRLALLSADGRQRIGRMRMALAPYLENALRDSLRNRVEGAWFVLGGPACVDDATELEDAGIFLDRLDELEDAGDLADLGVLEASLDDLYALPDLEALDTDVQIMTIHKAKGLEFDTVILPGLDRAPRAGERPLLAWKEQSDGSMLLAPINETGDAKDPMFRHVRNLQRDAEDMESARLLYVAATRAKSRLHLLGCVKCDDDGAERPPAKRSLLARLWPVIDAQVRDGGGAAAVDAFTAGSPALKAGVGNDAAFVISRLPLDWSPPAAPPAVGWEAKERVPVMGDAVEFSWAGETARHVGSVVHRWLQNIAEDEMRGWSRARVEELRPAFRSELSACGVEESELAQTAGRVAAALANALEDERGRWLLGPQRDARNEYRITAVLDGVQRHLVVDRLFTDANGHRRIIDYKTGSHEGADIDAYLDREQVRYRAQLERYAAALGGGRPGLYFPLLAGWREWSSGSDD